MPARKTFANNATLTAQDLNTYMNPSTAAHVPDAVAAGTATVPAIANGSVGSVAVAFPTNRFTVPPLVFTSTNNGRLNLWHSSVTASGFTAGASNYSGAASASSQINWFAVQMTPTNAAG